MKFSEKKDRKSGARTLQVTGEKREQLEYAQAEWLRGASEDFLLPFAYEASSVPLRFYYDVTGLAKLPTYLKAKLTGVQYVDMLRAVFDAMALCTKRGYPTSSVCFNPQHCYVDDTVGIRFACIPLSGVSERPDNNVRALLAYLAKSGNVKFVVEDDEWRMRSVDDFVRRTPVLSQSAMKDFLTSEFGLSLEGGSGSLKANDAQRQEPVSRQAATAQKSVASVAGFDMVAMLSKSASASEVVANQSFAERALDGVAGVSPTSAERVLGQRGEDVAGDEAGAADASPDEAQTPAPNPAPAPDPAPVPVQIPRTAPVAPTVSPAAPDVPAAPDEPAAPTAEPVSPPDAVPAPATDQAPVASARKHETVLLGRGSSSAVADFLSRRQAPRQLALVREKDGSKTPLDLSRPLTLGRSVASDITIDGNTNLSRCHAQLSRDGDGLIVKDMGSLNGVFVRGRRLGREEAERISMGERFLLADEAFQIVELG